MRIETNDNTQFKIACKHIADEQKKREKLLNSAGKNPYIYRCPWCDARKGCLCKDDDGKEYTDGLYHRARLMKDCLNIPIENKDEK